MLKTVDRLIEELDPDPPGACLDFTEEDRVHCVSFTSFSEDIDVDERSAAQIIGITARELRSLRMFDKVPASTNGRYQLKSLSTWLTKQIKYCSSAS